MNLFRKKWATLLPLSVVLLLALIFAIKFPSLQFDLLFQHNRFYGLVACLCAYLLLGLTPIPSDPLTFLILAWQGPVTTILMAALGNTLACLAEYYVGGSIGKLADFERRKQKLPFGLGQLPIHSPVFLLAVRLMPGPGGKPLSLASGAYKVPMETYLWTTAVANLIGAAFLALGGSGLLALFK
jgi:uncharacterized membrane protein YdjX (TVP38/TMEM64 family)